MLTKALGYYTLSIYSSFLICFFSMIKSIIIITFLNYTQYVAPFLICEYILSFTYSIIIAHDESRRNLNRKITPEVLYKDIKTEIHINCSICLEDFKLEESVKLTDCNHMFHNICIQEWINKKKNCPMCRCNLD